MVGSGGSGGGRHDCFGALNRGNQHVAQLRAISPHIPLLRVHIAGPLVGRGGCESSHTLGT